MNAGLLNKDVLYPIKAFIADSHGNDYIRIEHKANSSSYSNTSVGMLHNLETGILLLHLRRITIYVED